MNTLLETALSVCGTLIATELLRRLCPENQSLRLVGSLIALVLLVSVVGTALSLPWELPLSSQEAASQQEELSSYLEEAYQQAAQEDGAAYVRGLLASAGIQAEELHVLTDTNAEGSIELTEVKALFLYPADVERARALLGNVLGQRVALTLSSAG